jgi:hypothetical protein
MSARILVLSNKYAVSFPATGTDKYGNPKQVTTQGIMVGGLREALLHDFSPLGLDAHFTAYEPPPTHTVRLSYDAIAAGVHPSIVAIVFDVDAKEHAASEEWRAAERAKVSKLLATIPGFVTYETRGGYRLIAELATPVKIDSKEATTQWSLLYQASIEWLHAVHGIVADPACKDFTRLYRLPNVLRDGQPSRSVIVGNLGPWEFPSEVRGRAEALLAELKPGAAPSNDILLNTCDAATLDKLSKNLKKSKNVHNSLAGEMIGLIARGLPLGEQGDRHSKWLKALEVIGRELPEFTPRALAALCKTSLDGHMPLEVAEQLIEGARSKRIGIGAEWEEALLRTNAGVPKPCEQNIISVLTLHPDWIDPLSGASYLSYDEMKRRPVRTGKLPAIDVNLPTDNSITEDDGLYIAAWLQRETGIATSKRSVLEALPPIAKLQRFHPLKGYLRSLTWDGTSRIEYLLPGLLGTEDTPLSRAYGARWMISAVARIMNPGCKVDTMLVLEGRQGKLKSTALATLAGNPDWFADTPLKIGHNDAYLQLQGVWIYEIGELASFRGKRNDDLKLYVSSRVDRFRAPYERAVQDWPRQCVFAGTTNDDTYLDDDTGARRYWSVRCEGDILINGIKQYRDQLWAEAVASYDQGVKWWLHEDSLIEAQAESALLRQVGDPWTGALPPLMQAYSEKGIQTHIALSLLGENLTKANEMRMCSVLKTLGWVKRRPNNFEPRAFYPGPRAEINTLSAQKIRS